MSCCKCHDLTADQIVKEMEVGTMDEVCSDDPRHDCNMFKGWCPCEFTEEEAVGVLTSLDFEVVKREN